MARSLTSRRPSGTPVTTMDSLIPAPRDDDDEDVHWALSTSAALWGRGENAEALKWLRRAAETASDANADDRALELFKAAADVASRLEARSAPPPASGASGPPPPPPVTSPRSEAGTPPMPAAPPRLPSSPAPAASYPPAPPNQRPPPPLPKRPSSMAPPLPGSVPPPTPFYGSASTPPPLPKRSTSPSASPSAPSASALVTTPRDKSADPSQRGKPAAGSVPRATPSGSGSAPRPSASTKGRASPSMRTTLQSAGMPSKVPATQVSTPPPAESPPALVPSAESPPALVPSAAGPPDDAGAGVEPAPVGSRAKSDDAADAESEKKASADARSAARKPVDASRVRARAKIERKFQFPDDEVTLQRDIRSLGIRLDDLDEDTSVIEAANSARLPPEPVSGERLSGDAPPASEEAPTRQGPSNAAVDAAASAPITTGPVTSVPSTDPTVHDIPDEPTREAGGRSLPTLPAIRVFVSIDPDAGVVRVQPQRDGDSVPPDGASAVLLPATTADANAIANLFRVLGET